MEVTKAVILLTSVIVILLGFVYWWRNRRYFQLGDKLPGPPALPILGNALYFTTNNLCTAFQEFLQTIREYGPVARLWFGPVLIVFIADVDHAEKVLTHDKVGRRGYLVRKSFSAYIKNGLLSLDKKRWRIHRKIVSSALHIKILEKFVETFARHSDILANNLSSLADGTTAHDITPGFMSCALDALSETCFAFETNSQLKKNNNSVTYTKNLSDTLSLRMARPWLLVNWIFRLSDMAKNNSQAVRYFHDLIVNGMMRNHKRRQTPEELGTQKPTLLGLLIENGDLSKEEIVEEILTLAIAGTETTTSACCYVLALLGENQHIQDKVMQEQQDIFGDDILRPVRSEDLPRMTYLEQVFKEAMRLFPPVPIHSRDALKEIDLGHGHIIPIGAEIMISNYYIHRDPKHFPDPDKFDPDRFSPQNSANRHPYAYTPFGMGRRMCVGHMFATMEAMTILSTVLRRYRVTETEGGIRGLEERLMFGIVLQPINGVRVKLLPRTQPYQIN